VRHVDVQGAHLGHQSRRHNPLKVRQIAELFNFNEKTIQKTSFFQAVKFGTKNGKNFPADTPKNSAYLLLY